MLMQVTILDGPEDKPRECFFCRDIDISKALHIAIYKHLGEVDYTVETLWKYCPRCGKRIMSEEEYRKLWHETLDNDPRLFKIDGNIATDELIVAMNNAKNKYWEE
jgi:ribosomal protein S27AE